MEFKYLVSPYATLLENMVIRFWENTNLNPIAYVKEVILYEKNGAGVPTVGAGHQVQEWVHVVGLDKVPHTGKLYTASGTLLHDFMFEPSENIITLFQPIYFKIGDGGTNTPAIGDSSYANTALAGITNDQLIIHRSGTLMYPGVHFNTDPLGGFNLLVVGDIFGDEEEFLIQVAPVAVSNPVNDSVVGKQWGETTGAVSMYIDVTSSVNYLPIHLRKLIRISGSGAYHFDSAPPVGYPFRFINMVAGNPVVYFDVANLIQPGGDIASIIIPAGGIVEVVYDGTKFNLTHNNTAALGAMPYATITHSGSQPLGNIPAGLGNAWSIGIPNQGTASYKVLGSFRSVVNTNGGYDATCIWDIEAQFTNSFTVRIREFGPASQNIIFDFVIIKIN